MLGAEIGQAGSWFSDDEPRPGVDRRGHRRPWTAGRAQESVWIRVEGGAGERRTEVTPQSDSRSQVKHCCHQSSAIVHCPYCRRMLCLEEREGCPHSPLAPKRSPKRYPGLCSYSFHPDDPTAQSMPLPPTVSITQATIMVGHGNEIVFVQLWG